MRGGRDVEVEIDRLVLEGLDGHDPHEVAAAVEAELARAFTSGDAPRESDHAVLPAEPTRITPDADANAVGASVARAVHGGMPR